MVLFEYLSTNLLGVHLKSEIAEEYDNSIFLKKIWHNNKLILW